MAEVYFISGKCKWAKLFKPDTKYDENGIYSIQLYPDADGWDTYKRSGLNVRPKEDEDGKFITLRRKKVVNFGKGDQDIGGPEVVDAQNKALETLVGNDSTVTCKFETYQAGKYTGHRLLKVRVDNLVVYEKPQEVEGADPEAEPAPKAAGKAPKGLPF